MTTFKVTERRPSTQVWEYLVEAETKEEAVRKVVEGEEGVDYEGYYVDSEDRSKFAAQEYFKAK